MKLNLKKLAFNIKALLTNVVKYQPQKVGLVFFCFLFSGVFSLQAQNAYTTGTEFLFSYGDIHKNFSGWFLGNDTNSSVHVYICATQKACGQIEVMGTSFSQPFTLAKDSIL